MRIKSIREGATVRLVRTGEVLKVGDDVGGDEAIRVEGGPTWPAHAVTFEEDGLRDTAGAPLALGAGRIGGMVIG